MKPSSAAGWLLVLALACAAPATADPIVFATGTPGPAGQTDGYLIGATGFTGVRIFVPTRVVTNAIGGHFASMEGTDLFGAIVGLTGSLDLPDSEELTTPDVLGAARITVSPTGAPVTSRIVSAPLEVLLTPGWYGLVFGAGLFGASGTGLFVFDNFPHTIQDIFGNGRGPGREGMPFQNGVLGAGRLYAFVEAEAAPVPEPSSLVLAMLSLGGLGARYLSTRRQR